MRYKDLGGLKADLDSKARRKEDIESLSLSCILGQLMPACSASDQQVSWPVATSVLRGALGALVAFCIPCQI